MESVSAPACDFTSLYNLLVDTGRQKLIIDVRTYDKYCESFIRGALSYPAALFDENNVPAVGQKLQASAPPPSLPDYIDKEDKSIALRGILYKTCVVYDQEGKSTGDAARVASLLLKEAKFTSVSYLEGGMNSFSKKKHFLLSSKSQNSRSLEGALSSEILADFLFLGSAENASNIDQLRALGITHILNMADELIPHDSVPIKEFVYMKCSLNDTVQDRMDQHVKDSLEFIESANRNGGKILVHCAMGISRSSAMVIAYLMKSQKISFKSAFELVKARRSVINPNPGFVSQLQNLEQEWMKGRERLETNIAFFRLSVRLSEAPGCELGSLSPENVLIRLLVIQSLTSAVEKPRLLSYVAGPAQMRRSSRVRKPTKFSGLVNYSEETLFSSLQLDDDVPQMDTNVTESPRIAKLHKRKRPGSIGGEPQMDASDPFFMSSAFEAPSGDLFQESLQGIQDSVSDLFQYQDLPPPEAPLVSAIGVQEQEDADEAAKSFVSALVEGNSFPDIPGHTALTYNTEPSAPPSSGGLCAPVLPLPSVQHQEQASVQQSFYLAPSYQKMTEIPPAAPYRQFRSRSFSAWEDRAPPMRRLSDSMASSYEYSPHLIDSAEAEEAPYFAHIVGYPPTHIAGPTQYASYAPVAATRMPGSSSTAPSSRQDSNKGYLSFSLFPPLNTDIQPSSSSDDDEKRSSEDDSQESIEVRKPQRKKAKGPHGEPLPRVKRVPYKILKNLPSEPYDELVTLEVKDLRARLAANNQCTKGPQMDLMARIADAFLHGCLPECPQCHRCLVVPVVDGGYVCQSSTHPTTAGQCSFAANDVQRASWRAKEGCAI